MTYPEVIVPRLINAGSAEPPFVKAGSTEPDASGDE